jgi:uncharacterized protein (TIGR03435 family)
MMRILWCLLIAVAGSIAQTGSHQRFEAAAVRALTAGSGTTPLRRIAGGPGTADPGQITYSGQSLRDLLFLAYRVQFYQMNPPAWMENARFEIAAKLPPGATREDLPAMLQDLLAERFHLEIHRETHPMAGYALKAGPKGAKLAPAPSTPGEPPSPAARSTGPHFDVDASGFVKLPPGVANVVTLPGRDGVMRLTGARQTVGALCGFLSRELQQPVIDETGLRGLYDFRLAYAPENVLTSSAPPETVAGRNEPGVPAASNPAPTVIQAVESQLGLIMERRRIPVEVLVIDHVDRMPDSN